MPNLFRIHIRPEGGSDDMSATFQHCLDNRLLGVGWRVDGLPNTTDWRTFEQAAKGVHESIQQPRYIHDNVERGDLVWTRDPQATYYLARVRSGWEYWNSREGREKNIDIGNIFRCDFCEVEEDQVPGVVVASFGARGRSIQRIRDSSALVYSQHRWNQYADDEVYDVGLAGFPDIFTMLSWEETEDVVFLYLQEEGWHVVPSSRQRNRPRYEFSLVRAETGEKARTQVKCGDEPLNVDDYAEPGWHTFLFQANELYGGQQTENVTCITRDQLETFLRGSVDWLPQSIRTKLDMVTSR